MNDSSGFSPLGEFVDAQNGAFVEVGTPNFEARLAFRGSLNSQQVACSRFENSIVSTDFRWLARLAPSRLLDKAIGYFREVMARGGVAQLRAEGGGLLGNDRPSDIPCRLDAKDHSALHQMEALVWLTCSKDAGWQIRVPPQYITAGKVYSIPITPSDNVAIVLHSHGRLAPIWSAIDDNDETDGFVYGVVGNLHRPQATISLRVGFANQFLSIRSSDVFAS